MKINEIELVSAQNYPVYTVSEMLELAQPDGTLGQFVVFFAEYGNYRTIILTDDNKNIAAFATFEIQLGGKVWQARKAQTYSPYQGQALVAKIYKLVKEQYRKSIQSDSEQSLDAKKLWTKTLPGIGLHPMVFDSETEMIIEPKNFDLSLMYPFSDDNRKFRYTWILEKFDHYPTQNILTENTPLIPVTGLWYTGESNVSN